MVAIVKSWNPERGFGWLKCSDGRQFFLHISNYDRKAGVPKVGSTIQFEVGENARTGRVQAVNARPVPVDNSVGASALLHSVNEVTKLNDGTEVHRVEIVGGAV